MASHSIRHQMKEEFIIRDKYFPYIESFLPKTEKLLFKHIARYEDKWSGVLTSPYPLRNLPFGENDRGEDNDIVFKCTGIDPDEMRALIKTMPLPGKLTKEKAAFNPIQITLYLIIRYYTFTNQLNKAKIIYPYYGYSIYWKRWEKSFPHGVNEQVMIYTINNMSYRNLIKKLGSVKLLLEYVVEHVFEYYREGLANSCDEDIRYILDQVQSDISGKVNTIASAYYKDHANKTSILTSSTTYEDGSQRVDASTTGLAESYAQNYTHKFFSDTISSSKLRMACSLTGEVSQKEIENTLNYIKNEVSPDQVHDFYSAIFFYFLSMDDPNANEKGIHSMFFLAKMKPVVTKGNSINKNITMIIKCTNEWLDNSSNTFRITTREGTRTNYRKALYYYFLLLVANK